MKKKREPEWMKALRADVARRGSITKTALSLGFSKATISLVLAGKYPGRAMALEARVREKLMNRTPRTPQFKRVDPKRHALVKEKCKAWGYPVAGVWWATPPDELEAYVMSRSSKAPDEFLAKLDRLGIPNFELSEDSVRSLFPVEPGT